MKQKHALNKLHALTLTKYVVTASLMSSCMMHAQLPTGTVLGVVSDGSASVVPGAEVQLTGTAGVQRTATTGSRGEYRFPALPVGTYVLRVTHAGFKSASINTIVVTVGEEAVENATLQIGEVTDVVNVTASDNGVNTTTAELGSLVGEREVKELPLNGRNYEDLTLLQPGVAQQTNTNIVAGLVYSSNGEPTRSNNFLLDGAIEQNPWGYGPASASGSTLGLDGIKEYQIVTNQFGAEYGLTMGSQTSIVSKGGSNQFHGDVFEYIRNSSLDARNYFDYINLLPRSVPSGGRRIPEFQRNQFGGAIGGPIKKDKTYFFTTYEHLAENLGNPLYNGLDTVPSAGCHQAAGVTVSIAACPEAAYGPQPAIMSQAGALILAQIPLPNVPGTNEFVFASNQKTAEDYGQIRLDQNFNAKTTAFVRYTVDNTNQTRPRSFPQFQDVLYTRSQYLTLSATRILSETALNTARFSFSRIPYIIAGSSTIPDSTSAAYVLGKGFGSTIVGDQNFNGFFGPFVDPDNKTQNIYTFGDDFFLTHGRHAMKAGVLYNHFQEKQIDNTVAAGLAVFANTAFLIAGEPVLVQADQQANIPTAGSPAYLPNRYWTFNTLGFYFQDDYKISPRISLNLGLRYEFSTVPTDKNGHDDAFRNVSTATGGLLPGSNFAAYTGYTAGPIMQNATKKNFSPRLGVVWDVFGNGKTAIRAGGGIYYDLINNGGLLQNQLLGTPPYNTLQTVQFAPFGGPAPYLTLPVNFSYATGSVTTVNYYAKTPYSGQYNVGVQQQIHSGITASISYVGTRGIHLWALRDANPVGPSSFVNGVPQWMAPNFATCPNGTVANIQNSCRVNPHLGTFAEIDTVADSFYNSLQTDFRAKLGKSLTLQGAYTWSKTLDTTQGEFGDAADGTDQPSNPFNPHFDKGPTSFDLRNNFKFNSLYYFPTTSRQGFVGVASNGWYTGNIVSLQSGYPFSPLVGFNQSDSELGLGGVGIGLGNDRPSYVTSANLAAAKLIDPGAVVYNAKTVRVGKISEWYNPHMFTLPAYGTLGNVSRGIITGPGIVNWDFSLNKDTRVSRFGDAGKLEFKAEFFNVLNHTNAVFPGVTANNNNFNQTSVGSGTINPQAGIVTSTQVNARQIQFSLRADF